MWLKNSKDEDAKSYCKNLLVERKEKKDLKYTPTQVEMRTVMTPPIQYYDELFGSYYSFCESLGFENKYQKVSDITTGKEYEKPQYSIHVDTREQMPLNFDNYKTEIKTLSVGDYTFSEPKLTCNCYIERKSLADFISTLSVKNFERFEREIQRAKTMDANLIILIEESSMLKNLPFF